MPLRCLIAVLLLATVAPAAEPTTPEEVKARVVEVRRRIEALQMRLYGEVPDGPGVAAEAGPPARTGEERAAVQREMDALVAEHKGLQARQVASALRAEPPAALAALPRMDGSTSCHPIVLAVLGDRLGLPVRWSGVDPRFPFGTRFPRVGPGRDSEGPLMQAVNQLRPSGTGPAYLLLASGHRDLLLEARPPAADELRAAEQAGTGFVALPVALDAFVVVLHRDNPVAQLTREQVRAIYTGRITNWKEVGGRDARIHAYRREPLSGSEELFRTHVVPDVDPAELAPGRAMEIETMSGLMNAVAYDRDGIGYSVWSYQQLIDIRADVRPCAIDGAYPWHGSIARREYPWVAEILAVVRPDAAPATLQLRDWLLSDAGQAVVRGIGYVPVR